MPLMIIRNDITKVKADAIVNAANNSLLGGGGVDGAIHAAAGPELLAECRTLGGCETGMAKITKGYNLPAKYVIHTVGPVWRGGRHGERELLASCYRESLKLAEKFHCGSVAFPLISSGVYGYPVLEAVETATRTIRDFLSENSSDTEVTLVLYDRNTMIVGSRLFRDIKQYIGDSYDDERDVSDYELSLLEAESARIREGESERRTVLLTDFLQAEPMPMPNAEKSVRTDGIDAACGAPFPQSPKNIGEALANIGESFRDMLFRKLDELNMDAKTCCLSANITSKLFHKIKKDDQYRPSKNIVIAVCVALKLPKDEFIEMMMKGGYALAVGNTADVVVEYFISHGIYDIDKINSMLYQLGCHKSLLGGSRSDTKDSFDIDTAMKRR